MTTSRRGFLKGLTKIAIAIQAAPALRGAQLVFQAPPPDLEQIYTALDFAELLRRYYEPLLLEEIMRPSPLLARLAKPEKTWQGGEIAIPFTSIKVTETWS